MKVEEARKVGLSLKFFHLHFTFLSEFLNANLGEVVTKSMFWSNNLGNLKGGM